VFMQNLDYNIRTCKHNFYEILNRVIF